jgi:type I restriction enzyme S subunit
MQRMSKEKLIPELRFPEFKKDGEWKESVLGSVVEMKGRIGYRGYTTEDIVDKGKGAITLSPSNFNENGQLNFEKCTYISWEKYEESPEIQLEEGQTVLVKTASVGKTAYVDKLPEKATVNPQIVVLKPRTIHKRFLAFTISHLNTQNQIRNNVGAGAIPNISQEIISKIKILLPPEDKKKEQQKIASCLSSLDEVIADHSQKLELLKEHKKGLMQNLFPQEGENVPKYRFKEFEKDGEWVENNLGKEATFFKGKGISKAEIVENGELPCIRYGELYTYYKETIDVIKSYTNLSPDELFLSEENDVIIPASGETQIDIATASCVLRSGIALGGDLNIIRSGFNGVFLAYYLNSVKKSDIAELAQGISVVHLYPSQLQSLSITFPKKLQEQKKIASCLSSLDALLSSLTEKIEHLKRHKKGLMQGLFPKILD